MLGMGKYAQSIFYIEYSIHTPILVLWIKMAVSCSETACEMWLILSNLVQDYHLLMKCVIVYIIYLMIYLFPSTPMAVWCSSVWCLASTSRIISTSWKISIFWISTSFSKRFIPGLPYPGKFPYRGKYPYCVIFAYPVKASIHDYDR